MSILPFNRLPVHWLCTCVLLSFQNFLSAGFYFYSGSFFVPFCFTNSLEARSVRIDIASLCRFQWPLGMRATSVGCRCEPRCQEQSALSGLGV